MKEVIFLKLDLVFGDLRIRWALKINLHLKNTTSCDKVGVSFIFILQLRRPIELIFSQVYYCMHMLRYTKWEDLSSTITKSVQCLLKVGGIGLKFWPSNFLTGIYLIFIFFCLSKFWVLKCLDTSEPVIFCRRCFFVNITVIPSLHFPLFITTFCINKNIAGTVSQNAINDVLLLLLTLLLLYYFIGKRWCDWGASYAKRRRQTRNCVGTVTSLSKFDLASYRLL